MKIAALALLAFTLTAVAQQSVAPPATQEQLQQQSQVMQAQAQLLYEKLHGITEFQQYLALEQRMQQLQQQLAAIPVKAKTVAPSGTHTVQPEVKK